MVIFSNKPRNLLPLLPRNTSVAAIVVSSLSLPLLLPQAAGQKEVCSCFVIRSLKEKWDENRTGCVLGRLFALGRFHMRALVM